MKSEEQKLLDWQEKIDELKVKTTELKTKVAMMEKQLKDEGIKDIPKTSAFIADLEKEAREIAEKIKTEIEEIEEDFEIEDEG